MWGIHNEEHEARGSNYRREIFILMENVRACGWLMSAWLLHDRHISPGESNLTPIALSVGLYTVEGTDFSFKSGGQIQPDV